MTRTTAPKSPAQSSLSRWDDEGGALVADATEQPDETALPDGITMRVVREYIVGPFRYTDLAQAIAQNNRQAKR